MTPLNLIVIRAADPRKLARFYSALGLDFTEEKHGAGPTHFACELGSAVFEIYPRGPKGRSTTDTHLEFGVRSLEDTMARIEALGATPILQPPHPAGCSPAARFLDPEGHPVELRESASIELG